MTAITDCNVIVGLRKLLKQRRLANKQYRKSQLCQIHVIVNLCDEIGGKLRSQVVL